jgi:hypothetical protein
LLDQSYSEKQTIELQLRLAELVNSQDTTVVLEAARRTSEGSYPFLASPSTVSFLHPLPPSSATLLVHRGIARPIPCGSCISLTRIHILARHPNRGGAPLFFPRESADATE